MCANPQTSDEAIGYKALATRTVRDAFFTSVRRDTPLRRELEQNQRINRKQLIGIHRRRVL